jgi:AcrR family transcriptional regulator
VTDARKPYDIDSLTDVALRVFAERGYDGASMDDVARAAGITKASIYHHVAAKEEFLARGLRRALDALFAILEEAGAAGGEPFARLEYIFGRVAETTLELLPELSVLFRVRGNSPTEREAMERRRRFDRIVAELIAAGQKAGTVRRDVDPAIAARLLFGLSNSAVEWYRPGGRSQAAEVAGTIVGLALGALRP